MSSLSEHEIDLGIKYPLILSLQQAHALCQANFAARFLPSLVSAYKSSPGVCGPYTVVLCCFLCTSPYLLKYIRKTGQGYTLLMVHAHQMVQQPILSISPPQVRPSFPAYR